MRLLVDSVEVSAPATIGGFGLGKQAMTLAVSLRDRVRVRATSGQVNVTTVGVIDGHSETIVRALHRGLDFVGAPMVGVDLYCQNEIPRDRSLGAKTASILIGLTVARELVGPDGGLSESKLLNLAAELGADPFRAVCALHGGLSIRLPSLTVDLMPPPKIAPVIFVPQFGREEGNLDSQGPISFAAESAPTLGPRAALLGMILGGVPSVLNAPNFADLLFEATVDREPDYLHKSPSSASMALLQWLRRRGVPAILPGPGPTVVSLSAVTEEVRESASRSGWTVTKLEVAEKGIEVLESGLMGP